MSQAAAAAVASAPLVIGRYALFDELAAGGMATVHLGRLLGPVGFGRTVAVKRLHAHFLKDPEFITMFMDEARIVARIRHPNVVPMVDVVQSDLGLFLVMEYVHGESLSRLMRTARKTGEPIPPRIVTSIMCGVLLGLHAAHDTKGIDGQLLGVVHRDVSPQNVIVGVDGTARVLDFGIAKAAGRAQVTREGQIKGKLAYMAPEQIRGQVDRRTDVFAASVVLWEMLAGKRLHEGSKDVDIVTRVVQGNFPPPSVHAKELSPELDEIVMRGLANDPKKRFDSARDLALELERKVGLASPTEVSAWVERLGHDVLQARTNLVSAMELAAGGLVPVDTHPPPASVATEQELVPLHGNIPIHLDAMHTANGEVPSSSAVFAHAQTTRDAPMPSLAPRPMDRMAWMVVAVSCALAVVGITLGAYALLRRAGHAAPAAVPSATALPRITTPQSGAGSPPSTATPNGGPSSTGAVVDDGKPTGAAAAGAGTNADPGAGAGGGPAASTAPGTTAAGATSAAASAAATTTANGAGASTASAATAATGATTTATAATTTTATPATTAKPTAGVALPPPTVKKPPAKPACDPPYTVDDVGHRHYKPECMGLE